MSVNGKCQFSPKFIPLVKTWAQTKTDPEFRQLLDQFFENAEDVYNQFKIVTETPIGTIIGETTPETEPEIIPVEVIERSKSDARVVTTTDTISGLYVGRTEARKRMLRRFRREMLERSRLKISDEGKVTKVEPNVSILENGVTTINKNLYEYKVDLINILLKKIDPQSEPIPYDYDLSNEEFTALINKVLQTNVELTDVEWDAYVILSKFDDLIEQEVPFIKIRSAFSKADYRVEGINKYEYVGSKVEHDSSWSTNEFADSMHQASILAAVVLDYIPECDGLGRPIEDSSITLSGFYSCMTAMRDALMYHPTGALIEARKELRKGDNADMGVMISAYLQYLKDYKERSTSQYYNQHISYLIGKLESIRKYIFNSELDDELKSVFKQMFVKNVRMRYMGYGYDYSTERVEGKDLQSSAINTQTYALLDTMSSAIYRFRTQSSSAFSEALGNCGIIYKPGFNGTFTFLSGDNTITFANGKVSWNGNPDELTDVLENVFEELTGYSLPENFKRTFNQVNNGVNYNSVLGRAIAIIVNATNDGKLYDSKYIKSNGYPSELKRVELKTIAPLGKALSIIYGSNTANVVKNISGKKNFPLFGLNSLAYNYHYIMWQHMDNPSLKNIYTGSYLFESEWNGEFKPSLVLAPSIRSEIEINGKLKSVDQLTVAEVIHLALFSDFYRNIVDENSEAVTMQNTTFADKNTHFLINYRLDERVPNTNYTLRQMLQSILNPKAVGAFEKREAMMNLMYNTRRNRTNKLLENIVRDYNEVFGTNFQTLQQVNDWISEKGYTSKDIQKKFADVGVIAYEELHYCPKGSVINQQLLEVENAYLNRANFERILENQRRLFVKDLLENGFFVNSFLGREGKDLADKYPEWFDETGNMILAKDELGTKYHQFNAEEILNAEHVVLNPILESFFMADNLLSHEYNEIMIGGEYCHPGKDEASRLIAQIKRSVIFGATQHSFVQGLANGVASEIKMAVMPDMPADTRNIVGDEDLSFKSMDGSAECTMLQARLESNSLLDARSKGLGYDKKNIGHDIDSEYGRPTLLKFAVYAMTNARRRASFKSKASQDRLLKRMYSAGEITIDVDTLNRYLTEHPVYFETTEDGIHYYEVIGFVQNPDGTISRQIMECDSRGNNFGTVRTEPGIRMNTLWSIDQAFGGAFTMSMVDGKLKYSETNNDVLEQFVTENPKAKDCQIAYIVNKSAIKVGAGNVNSLDSWFNDDELKTITMHTRYMGVQMDAEHDLDHAEVTEMTQLISALSQSGFTSELVNEIYTTIGEVIDEALAEYKGAIADYLNAKYQGNTEQAEKEKLKIYNLLGKVFIESFESGDRDTIGLAQAFVLKASKALKDGRSDYRLPFSADTVNGIFISTVSSLINKRGIKRKYDGFAGVLSPAYNQIQFYRVGGKAYMYRKFAELVSDMGITGYTKPNLLTIDQGPQQKLWARFAHNSYEVSSDGDSRFSARYATFKPGTILFGHDVSGRTIESVYQHGIKQGDWVTDNNNKTGAPRDKTIITGNTEDDSYYQGYLPLWQEWARQNPELIEELRVRSKGKTLTDQYASSQANQARALAEILTKTESVQRGPLKLYRGYASNSTTPVSIKNVTKTAAVGLDDTSTDYIGQGLHFTSSKETAEEYARIHTEEFYPEYSERAGQRQKGFSGKYTHVMEVYIDTTNAKIGYYEDTNDYRRNSTGDEDIVVLKTDTLGHNDFEVKLAPGQEWRLVESPYVSAVDAAMNDYVINGRPNPFLKKIGQNEIDFEDTIVIREPDGKGGYKFTEVYVNSRAKYYDLKRTVRPNAVYYRFESKPRNLKGPNTKFEVNGKTYSVHDLDSVYAIEQMQQNPEKVEILPRTLSYEGKIKYAEEKGWIYTLRRHDTNEHFGNPFAVIPSEVQNGRASMLVRNVKIAAEMYEAWLRGDKYYELDGKAVDLRNIEPERRAWIIKQFESGTLIGKTFAYYTEDIPDDSWVDENGEVIKKYDYHKAPNHAHILMKLAHEWMADKVLAKMEELPFISDEFRVEKPVETADLETWKTTAEFYSGAADGSDKAWAKYLRELGLNVKDFTTEEYDALSQQEKDIIEVEYAEARSFLGKPILSGLAGKLTRRDMMQADKADAIFAIAERIIRPGEIEVSNGTSYPNKTNHDNVSGGTANAVARGILRGIPVYVYDMSDNQWKTWDVNTNSFVVTEEPVLTPHAAVIGTRDNREIKGPEALRSEGHDAIKSLITKTFGEQTPSAVEEIQEGRLSTEGYYYNAQQVAAIDGVSDIIKRTMANPNGGPSFVTIQGMAGTGKTSIINAILESVAEDYDGYAKPIVEISAVSHKAKSVLFSKISKGVHSKFKVKAHSLAGLLGKGFNVETGEYEKGQSEKVPPIEEAKIIFVDEASMLNEEDLNSIYEGTNGRNVTVVFIGDIGQINPIRNSPFFRNLNIAPDAPSPIFTTPNIPIFRLTERVRQGEDSPVLAYADRYYQFNTGQTAQYPNEVGQSSEDGRLLIQHGDIDLPTQLQDLFVEATQTLNPNKVKIVAGRQTTVDSYNRRVQRITNPQVTDDSLVRFGIGDLVIFNDNYQSGRKSILNAQEGQVIEIDPTIYTDSYDSDGRLLVGLNTVNSIDIEYYNVTIKLDSGEIVTVKIPVITDSNISKLFTLRHNAMSAAKQDRSKWKIYYALKGEYAISLNDYKGTHKPLVSLGYAITAHKAQGSTYDVVAVDLDDIHSVAGGWTAVDKAKIIYTGLTRGSNISIVKDSRSRNNTSPDVKEINDRLNLTKAAKTTETKAVEHEQVHEELVQVLGGDDVARREVQDAVKVVQTGKTFEEVLAEQPAFFTPTEQLQIKSALGDRKLKVMSASRRTDPVFLANDIIKFLEENAKKDFTDPTRVNVIEIWSKHDGMPMRDILNACKKYRVAPIVSFSITGLGGTSLEKGVMKHTDLLPLIGELITAGTLNPATTTIRIDPILPGVTDMNVIKDIVRIAKSFGIKKYVTSMVQSYDGYGRGVVEGINAALASEGKTYDWEKYYGIQTRGSKKGKLNFKPKQEWIDAIGSVLLEINADPEITLETCAFKVKGLKASACLDPLIIERLTGIDVMSQDGSYDRDTSRPECMCYGVHSDMFKYDHKCASSCAYCYAAHSEDSPFSYYDNEGNLIDSPLTRTRDKVVKRFRGRISADKFKLLQERVQSDLRNLRKGRSVVLNGQEVVATNARVIPGECITGRYHAKQYMMEQGDNISDIDVNFFARKLRSRYSIDEYENNEYCSGVLFATNGEKYMVKVASAEEINEMLLKDPNVTLDKSIENIGGVYYKGDDVVANAEGIKFCTVNVDGQLRNLILVEESALIGRLKNSSFFGFYRHVHNDDAKIDSEARWFNDEINTIAKEVYDSFIKQRLVIGTRIPTQAMPSFMPMDIIDFTDSDVNDEYVPTDLLSIQGADLDIDKEYTLDLAIDEIGKVYTFSKLSFVDYMIDDLLDIKLPNGREFKLSNDPNALIITDIDLGTDADSKEVRSRKWVALINKCMSAPAISYVGSNPKLMDRFLRDLNTHCTSKLSRHHKEQALKNKIAVSIKKVTMSIENQAIAQISVDTSMGALKKVAKNSALAKKEESMSSSNPATKFVMQIQNMVGKQVISVTAVSLKQFFARTAYWNSEINNFEALIAFKKLASTKDVPEDSAIQAAVIDFIDKLCKVNPITGKRVPLSNLNFRDLLDRVRSDKSLNIKFGIPKWTPDTVVFSGLKIEYVPYGSLRKADGSIVGARCDGKNKRMFIDLQTMQEKYESKAWTTSKYSDNLDIDFQSFEEWMTFTAYHELGHYILEHRYDKTYNRRAFENEANAFAVDKILHLREVGDRTTYSFNGVFVKNLEELIIQIQKIADRIDASQLISALLSAATDNAKELILPKLNATTNFADIYTYLFSLGCTAEEVGKIMTSKQFSFIASIVNGNIFGVPPMKIQDAINLYLQQGTVPQIDLNLYNLAFGTHFIGVNPEQTFNERTKNLLQNESAINQAILNIKSLMGKKPTEDDSGWLHDVQIRIVARDFISNPVSWGEGTAMIKVLLLHREILRARKAYENENNDADLIKLVTEILPGVEEQKILGTLTGLNQGLKTQAYEKRKWIQNVENYINRLFPLRFDWDLLETKRKEGLIGKNEEFDEDRYAVDADYRSVWKDIVTNPISFKFARFLNDKLYQEEWINKMDRVKVSDNILRIIMTVPHFAKMMDAWRVDHTLIRMNVARNNIENQVADKLKSWRTQSISEAEWGQIKKYVNDVLIYNWITTQGFTFEYPKDGSYTYYDVTGQLVPATKPIQIDSLTGIASFKQYMEQYLIPALKQKYGKHGVKPNAFIEALQLGATENPDGTINKYYKLPISMMNIDANASIEAQYNNFLMAFNEIAEYTINGWKIGDLFYLYNLIVHKDGFGQSSLTRIFEDLVSGDDNLLVNRYNRWISQLDENAETAIDTLKLDLEDAKYRISKQIRSSQIRPTNNKLTMIDDNFTLMLPSMIGIIQEPMQQFEPKRTVVPSVKVGLMNDLIHGDLGTFALTKDDFSSDEAFIAALQEAGIKNVGNFVKMREFAREQKAFVFEGIVFLNSSKADVTDLIHEWAHIILAKMKWGTERQRTEYYNTIASVVKHPKFNEIAERYKIDGKLFLHGSDLQEEVFVNLMQMYLQGRVFNDDNIVEKFRSLLHESTDEFIKAVEELVNDHIDSADFVSVLLDALDYGINDSFKDDFVMQKHQGVANLKNKLVKEDKLKWECNG